MVDMMDVFDVQDAVKNDLVLRMKEDTRRCMIAKEIVVYSVEE